MLVSGLLLTKGTLAVLRLYNSDSLFHLRRAVELCAFSARVSKHHGLARVFGDASENDPNKYRRYKREFRNEDVFPKKGHPDYDPTLGGLYTAFDLDSKLIHTSVFGMAGHFVLVPSEVKSTNRRTVVHQDLPQDMMPLSFLHTIQMHWIVLTVFWKILKPYARNPIEWEDSYKRNHECLNGKISRHLARISEAAKGVQGATSAASG